MSKITSNPESEQGYDAIERHFPPDPTTEYVNELILVRSDTLTVDDAASWLSWLPDPHIEHEA